MAAALVCGAAAAAVAWAHGADVRRGPVPSLARVYAGASVELTVTGDPRLTRPRVRGAAPAPVSVVLEAEATRVAADHGGGSAATTRAPVLVIAQPRPQQQAAWLRLLPSTRLRVHGRLAPPMRDGDRIAAVVRVNGGGAPQIVAGPTAA
ncbi:ComEC/Rec2 family competence protein, partial [Streptomyces sp. NPDC000941]